MNEIQENYGNLEKLRPGFDQMREAQLADPMPGLETRRDRLQRLMTVSYTHLRAHET